MLGTVFAVDEANSADAIHHPLPRYGRAIPSAPPLFQRIERIPHRPRRTGTAEHVGNTAVTRHLPCRDAAYHRIHFVVEIIRHEGKDLEIGFVSWPSVLLQVIGYKLQVANDLQPATQ